MVEPTLLTQKSSNMSEYLSNIDKFYSEHVENIYVILLKMQEMYKVTNMSGLGLAKFLWKVKNDWNKFRVDDEFKDVIYQYVGIQPVNIERYINVWKLFETNQIPDNLKDNAMQLGIKSLIPIAKAREEGYEINETEWKELATATNDFEVREILREIKGETPRSVGLTLKLTRAGDIVAYTSKGRYFVGYLNLLNENEENDKDAYEAVNKAISRIISSSGIIKE